MGKFISIILFLFACVCKLLGDSHSPFVLGRFEGRLGNNMFQVATACAIAWDNDAKAFFPDINPSHPAHAHVFSRCKKKFPKDIKFTWHEPTFAYTKIHYHPNMQIVGWFQSEKYFAHHREKILSLFEPLEEDLDYMKKKYQWLLDHPQTVGVQIRCYREEGVNTNFHFQYGKDYLDKAMSLFRSDNTLFVISSDRIDVAKKYIPSWALNVFFLNEASYIDLYLLSFCKHNIISNSSFGWWAAWLNKNPEKIVVAPKHLFNLPTEDYCPENWIRIDAEQEKS